MYIISEKSRSISEERLLAGHLLSVTLSNIQNIQVPSRKVIPSRNVSHFYSHFSGLIFQMILENFFFSEL